MQRKDMITFNANTAAYEKIKNFDDTTMSGEKAIEQLKVIITVIQNFKELRDSLDKNQPISHLLENFKNGDETTYHEI